MTCARMDRKKIPDKKMKMVRTTYAIGELKYARSSRSTIASMLRIGFFALLCGSQFQENILEAHGRGLEFVQTPTVLHNCASQIAANILSKFTFDLEPMPAVHIADFLDIDYSGQGLEFRYDV